MALTIKLKREVQRALAKRAKIFNMDVSLYAAIELEKAMQPYLPPKPKQSLDEFFMNSPLRGSGINLERSRD
jgi:hypothetical protein